MPDDKSFKCYKCKKIKKKSDGYTKAAGFFYCCKQCCGGDKAGKKPMNKSADVCKFC